VGIALPGDILSMVTTRGKAVAKRSVGTHTEVSRSLAAGSAWAWHSYRRTAETTAVFGATR